ncbi:MAG: hypothetical protein JSW11_18495 [Candidatus Heimdallarchaeota archaeon]|nr:MAG: hypothetical protein JSW11_18495 [Candidatus Heimdallarchaeota archaeon]
MSLEILPKVLQQLTSKIEALVDLYYPDRSQTLPVRINKRKQNIIVTWNIYPSERHQLDELFPILSNTIEENLKGINGEIIHCSLINGEIRDRGIQEFQIHMGKTWEIYLYDPETYIDVRLLQESRITQPLDKWLSIDIDIVTESAWFD